MPRMVECTNCHKWINETKAKFFKPGPLCEGCVEMLKVILGIGLKIEKAVAVAEAEDLVKGEEDDG